MNLTESSQLHSDRCKMECYKFRLGTKAMHEARPVRAVRNIKLCRLALRSHSGLQGSQLAVLERAWRERDRGADAASAAATKQAAVGAAGLAGLGVGLAGTPLPCDASDRPGCQLDTIPEEVVGISEHRSGTGRAEPAMPTSTGSQQLTAPGQQNLKRRKVLKRPPLGGSLLEGF